MRPFQNDSTHSKYPFKHLFSKIQMLFVFLQKNYQKAKQLLSYMKFATEVIRKPNLTKNLGQPG